MIGYYVHHVGYGHVQRAIAVAQELHRHGYRVAGLSSLPSPPQWPGDWHRLARDDSSAGPVDTSPGGRLHWAPLGDAGLRARMASIAAWIDRVAPSVFVSDLSVEITALARLHGIPVVTTVLPGRRDDPAHQLGFDLADVIVAPWPALTPEMCVGLEPHFGKVVHIGGLSRFDLAPRRRVTAGPGASRPGNCSCYREPATTTPTAMATVWRPRWKVSADRAGGCAGEGEAAGSTIHGPICAAADVVVTHAGLGAISDVAAARKPTVVVPERRPHDEQAHTAAALRACGLALVLDGPPRNWSSILEAALTIDPAQWSTWSHGDATSRFADLIVELAVRPPC